MSEPKTALVISAHAADFIWRCGGAIVLHAEKGYEVTVVCQSFGERGESAKLWRQPCMTLAQVKAARRAEAEKAATALGVHDLICFDLGDYPLRLSDDGFGVGGETIADPVPDRRLRGLRRRGGVGCPSLGPGHVSRHPPRASVVNRLCLRPETREGLD